MRTFLSISANRSVDDYAIKNRGIPGKTLMKNAGEALVTRMELHGFLEGSPKILVLAGKGNNGGDGYVIASTLLKQQIAVSLITTVDEPELSGAALHHFSVLKDSDINIEIWQNSTNQQNAIKDADVIIDALLGTGISGELRSPYPKIINLCNLSKAQIVAVDVPSGLSGDLGNVLKPAIKADLTVSMGFGKQGHLFEPARSQSRELDIVDIGFPEDSLDHIRGPILQELEASDFDPSLYSRPADAHKYSSGKVYLIAGSKGFTGAAVLAATAALRSGAGLVKLALPESLGQIGETATLETIIEYMPETNEQSLASDAFLDLIAGSDWADVVAIGPGLGRHEDTLATVRALIKTIESPLIIDADALFALSQEPQILIDRKAPTILTPHLGEFKRLLKKEDSYIPTWHDAQKFAMKYQVFVLLKGAPSLIASPEGEVYVNSSGYQGMATAGSGDVLTGVIAALWSQWNQAPEVLNFAMYMHGKAADLNRAEKGVLGLIASDIVKQLPAALKEYGNLPT